MTARAGPHGDFAAQAAAYGRSRPGYPPELLGPLLVAAGVASATRASRVCELGAGTGAFSAMLSAAGLRVLALEPGAAMRAQAPEFPGVDWGDGSFEVTGLDDASQDWVVAAQAFHWADPPRALPELRRVLRRGGCLSVFWNGRENERDPHLARAWAEVQRAAPGFEDVYKQVDWERVLASTGDFDVVACHAVRHVVRMDRARFLDLWRSHKRLADAIGAQGVAGVVAAVEDDLRRRGVESVDVPYLCRGWTARARHAASR